MVCIRLAAVALTLASASPARAGVVIEGKGEGGEPQRFLLEGDKMRVESKGGQEAFIFDGSAGKSYQLDGKEKAYTEFTKADMAKIHAMMKQGSGEKKVLSTRYEKTGRTAQTLGRTCDVYRMTRSDSRDEEEMCVLPFGTFGVERADLAGFRALGDFTSYISGNQIERDWANLPGVPVIAWEKEGGGAPQETFRATKVEKRSIAASEFTVPKGWKRNPGLAEQIQEFERLRGAGGGGTK